jgi:transcriptional regulator with XRE-family HTH domain
MNFGPQNAHEAEIFAVEELRADIQYEILRMLRDAGISQSDLGKRIGCSAAAVSQFLDDDANLTVETIARIFLAFGRQAKISAVVCGEHFDAAKAGANSAKGSWSFEESVLVAHKSRSTTDQLMAVFRDTGRKRLPANLSNDNSSFYEETAGQVA